MYPNHWVKVLVKNISLNSSIVAHQHHQLIKWPRGWALDFVIRTSRAQIQHMIVSFFSVSHNEAEQMAGECM